MKDGIIPSEIQLKFLKKCLDKWVHFIQAYKGIESIEDVNNVYAWLGGIVYRQGMQRKD